MNTALKLALATAAVIAVVVIGSTFLPRNGSVIGGPGVATPSPGVPESPAPSPSDQAFHMIVAGTHQPAPAWASPRGFHRVGRPEPPDHRVRMPRPSAAPYNRRGSGSL